MPGAGLYSSIAVLSCYGYVAELACCAVAWWYYAARLVLARGRRDARRSGHVAVYCGFGFIPGERRTWDGSSLKGGIGGSEQCAIRLSVALAKAGRDVVVYGGASGRFATVDGVRYEPAWSFDAFGVFKDVVVWRLPQLLLVQRLGSLCHPGSSATCLRAKTVTYWIHDGAYLQILARAGEAFRRSIRYAIRITDTIVLPSEEMHHAQQRALAGRRRAFDAHARRAALVLPHGVPRYFDPTTSHHRRDGWLLWPVSVERGLDALLSVLPKLRRAVVDRGGDFKLFVCHLERGYHASLPGTTTTQHVPDDVVFTGMLPPPQLAVMLRTCALFVFPSSVPESFSLSTWECAAHGVLPLVYGLGALKALEHVGCPVATPGDIHGLADQAAALLADPNEAQRRRTIVLNRTNAAIKNWDQTAATWADRVLAS